MQWRQKSKITDDNIIMFERVRGEGSALVIWKHANPGCFKDQLSVEYYSNKNAWMTSGVFET